MHLCRMPNFRLMLLGSQAQGVLPADSAAVRHHSSPGGTIRGSAVAEQLANRAAVPQSSCGAL